MWLLAMIGCPWVGPVEFEANIEDVDGDGEKAERFGGRDCVDDDPSISDCDADRDGARNILVGGPDCDDTDAEIRPGAVEICNGIDDDCDGAVDQDDDTVEAFVWYADADADGFGGTSTLRQCDAPVGFVRQPGDCDDGRADVSPAASEFCDDVDHNCDGEPHLDAMGQVPLWPDLDGDGFGDDGAVEAIGCPVPGVATQAGDCDDADDSVFGGEVCDGIDNDCDGAVDDADDDVDLSTTVLAYRDLDGDGFGDPMVSEERCDVGDYALVADDCDDLDPSTHVGADEVCDNRDNDCDEAVDEGAVDAGAFFNDADGDGFGGASILACIAGPGVVRTGGDCADFDPQTYPGAPEICGDAVRQDCSTFAADDCDADGEAADIDCNDDNPDVNTAATEVCDGIDNDCDGLLDGADDDVTGPDSLFFVDGDGDGFGSTAVAGSGTPTCDPPPGSVGNSLDCDDTDPLSRPGANERCDGEDNDCDGQTDELPVVDAPTYYRDADGDAVGDPLAPSTLACAPPTVDGWVVAPFDDCDDSEALVYTGATEVCDGLDNDCDGLADSDDPDADLPTWYLDNDADGFGQDTAVLLSCEQPAGYSDRGNDCNDNDPDAQASVDWFADRDGDGFGDPATIDSTCIRPVGFVRTAGDCDDDRGDVNPGNLVEVCDGGSDEDCDGAVDDADSGPIIGQVEYAVDLDGDHHFDELSVVLRCAPDADSSPLSAFAGPDCDDTDASVSPLGMEICDAMGRDEDCDGLVDEADPDVLADVYYRDLDGDGLGNALDEVGTCGGPPAGYVALSGDCNDLDPTLTAPRDWYRDADGDGFGESTDVQSACTQPVGHVALATDCDDSRPDVHPGVVAEVCDGGLTDEDCDGFVDDEDLGLVLGRTSFASDVDMDSAFDPDSVEQRCSAIGDQQPLSAFTGPDCDDTDVRACLWRDADGDGFGDPLDRWDLEGPAGTAYVDNAVDCDDTKSWLGRADLPIRFPTDVPFGTLQATVDDVCEGMEVHLMEPHTASLVLDRHVILRGRDPSVARTVLTNDGSGVGAQFQVTHPDAVVTDIEFVTDGSLRPVLQIDAGAVRRVTIARALGGSVVMTGGLLRDSLLTSDGVTDSAPALHVMGNDVASVNDLVVQDYRTGVGEPPLVAVDLGAQLSSSGLVMEGNRASEVIDVGPGMTVEGRMVLDRAMLSDNSGTIEVIGQLSLDRSTISYAASQSLFQVATGATLDIDGSLVDMEASLGTMFEGSGAVSATLSTLIHGAPSAPWATGLDAGSSFDQVVLETASASATSFAFSSSILSDVGVFPAGNEVFARVPFMRKGTLAADQWDLHIYPEVTLLQAGHTYATPFRATYYDDVDPADGLPDGWVATWASNGEAIEAADYPAGGLPGVTDTDGDFVPDATEGIDGTRADTFTF